MHHMMCITADALQKQVNAEAFRADAGECQALHHRSTPTVAAVQVLQAFPVPVGILCMRMHQRVERA